MSDLSREVASPASSPGERRWLLTASLAVNLLLIGALAAAWVMGHRSGPGRWDGSVAASPGFGLIQYARGLPDAQKTRVRAYLSEGRKAAKPLREELRAARQRAAAVLSSETYSIERLSAAMEEVGAAEARLWQDSSQVLRRSVDALTPEQRRDLGALWARRLSTNETSAKGKVSAEPAIAP